MFNFVYNVFYMLLLAIKESSAWVANRGFVDTHGQGSRRSTGKGRRCFDEVHDLYKITENFVITNGGNK